MSDSISRAAAALGRKGGSAGRGQSKRRSPEHYREAARRSAEVRRAKRLAKEQQES